MGKAKIRSIGEVWTVIMCGQCNTPFQVMNGRYPWQMNCPYCSCLIELSEEPKPEIVRAADAKV